MSDVYEAQKAAMDQLAQLGPIALPEILAVLEKPAAFYDGDKLIRMLITASGHDSGHVLHERLKQDLIWWKLITPSLTESSLGEMNGHVGMPVFMKFNETKLIIEELEKERYYPAAATVGEFHSFWISQPTLYNPQWGQLNLKNGGSALDFDREASFQFAAQCEEFAKHAVSDTHH